MIPRVTMTMPAALNSTEARRLTEQLRATLAVAVDLLGRIFDGRGWEALGYPTWEDYCAQELPDLARLGRGLPHPERQAVVAALREDHGMSLRAISRPLGLSHQTVYRDLAASGVQLPRVNSLDGRQRPGWTGPRGPVVDQSTEVENQVNAEEEELVEDGTDQSELCHLCSGVIDDGEPGGPWSFTWDHLVPRALGGSDDAANLRPAHRRCNIRRGLMSLEEWRQRRLWEVPPLPLGPRRGRQLGLRIHEDLKARLAAASEGTYIPMSTLLRVALDEKLKALGY
jgi:DNA-binding transcriptional ArsR family regulator